MGRTGVLLVCLLVVGMAVVATPKRTQRRKELTPPEPTHCLRFNPEVDTWVNVDFHEAQTLESPTNFTIEAWVFLQNEGGGVLLEKHHPLSVLRLTNETNYMIRIGEPSDSTDSRLGIFAELGGRAQATAWGNSHMSYEEWHHVAVAYNNTHVNFFVDGCFDGAQTWETGDSNSGGLFLGRDAKGNYFAGAMSELRIWNTSRTEAEIRRFMLCHVNALDRGLAAYYQMGEGRGNLLRDSSLNQMNGLIYDGRWTDHCPGFMRSCPEPDEVKPWKDCNAVSSCPNDCSSRGKCVDGRCRCNPDAGGDDCSGNRCPHDCSHHGSCISGLCQCDDGFSGNDCSQASCPKDCCGNGACLDGKCSCGVGWAGVDCCSPSEADPYEGLRKGWAPVAVNEPDACVGVNCNGHGTCVNGKCQCDKGWTGYDCTQEGCPRNCCGHGSCLHGRCSCIDGYSGQDCCIRACPNDCSNRGRCNNGTCVCNPGFRGDDCSQSACPNDCSGHGMCVNGHCFCNALWTGEDCSTSACPKGCSGHGLCHEGRCICDTGFSGEDCAVDLISAREVSVTLRNAYQSAALDLRRGTPAQFTSTVSGVPAEFEIFRVESGSGDAVWDGLSKGPSGQELPLLSDGNGAFRDGQHPSTHHEADGMAFGERGSGSTILAVRVTPSEGFSTLSLSGTLEPGVSDRSDGEVNVFDWKVVFSQDGKEFVLLSEGSFKGQTDKRTGRMKFISGLNSIKRLLVQASSTPPNSGIRPTLTVYVRNSRLGYRRGGAVLLADNLVFGFSSVKVEASLSREDAWASTASRSPLSERSVSHESLVSSIPVRFQYHMVWANAWDEMASWQLRRAEFSKFPFPHFGNEYSGCVPHAFYWGDEGGTGEFVDILGYSIFPVEGFNALQISGEFLGGANTRAAVEHNRIDWRIVRMRDGRISHAEDLTRGFFTVERDTTTNKGRILPGGTFRLDRPLVVGSFTDGSVSVFLKITRTNGVDNAGMINIVDKLKFGFLPSQ